MDDVLHEQLTDLAVEAGDGSFTADKLAEANGSLSAFGYSSLSYMRLIDAIENELGVYLDPEADLPEFESIARIAELVRRARDTD